MALFHIHIYNDDIVRDEEGRDFPDLAAAKVEAIRGGRSLIAEHVTSGRTIHLDDHIEITNAGDDIAAIIEFREMITVSNQRDRSKI